MDQQDRQAHGSGGGLARPRLDPVAELRAATGLLTRLPVGMGGLDRSGSAAFALVGAVLGACAAVPAALLLGATPLLAAVTVPAILALVTGVLHLDGLADTADALVAPTPERAEAARKDPRVGAAGAVALVLVLAAQVGAIEAIPAWAVVCVASVAGAASRAVPPLAAVVLRPRDGAGEGFGAWFAARSGPGGAASAVLVVLLVAVLAGWSMAALAPAWSSAWRPAVAGLGAGVAGVGAGLALAAALNRRFGRLAGDSHGAAIEIAFLAALVTGALAWSVR